MRRNSHLTFKKHLKHLISNLLHS